MDMNKKIEYTSANEFMFDCVRRGVMPAIHWRDDDCGKRGFIWFKCLNNYIVSKNEIHIFYSSDKKLLDAIWNSIGLIRHATRLVDEVKNV